MLFSLPVIPLILFAICLLSAITLYLVLRLKIPATFGKVMQFTLGYIFFNSLYTFFTEIYFPGDSWKYKIAPFILMYGPILYFGIVSLRDNKLPLNRILWHALPFLIYTGYFLSLHLELIEPTPGQLIIYSRQLYVLGPVSFLIYTLFSFVAGRNLFVNRFRNKLLMFVFGRTLLLFLAVLFLIAFSTPVVNDLTALTLLRAMIYSCMLIFVLVVFNYVINKLLNRFPVVYTEKADVPIAKYERSALAPGQLEDYGKKLADAMEKDQLFLDTSLSLSSLSLHLKIPTHHLTQVLSMMFRKTFYQYVNGYRITYACKLLERTDSDMNLDELAERSGYNSKVSFHRQFKNIQGCTPAEYRLSKRRG